MLIANDNDTHDSLKIYDCKGHLAFHYACIQGDVELVKYLSEETNQDYNAGIIDNPKKIEKIRERINDKKRTTVSGSAFSKLMTVSEFDSITEYNDNDQSSSTAALQPIDEGQNICSRTKLKSLIDFPKDENMERAVSFGLDQVKFYADKRESIPGMSGLYLAARANRPEIVKLLLTYNRYNPDEDFLEKLEIVKQNCDSKFIEVECHEKTSDPLVFMPLYIGKQLDRQKMYKVLIESNRLYRKSDSGRSLIDFTTMQNRFRKKSILHMAITYEKQEKLKDKTTDTRTCYEIIKALIKEEPNLIKLNSSDKVSCLQYAVKSGSVQKVRMIMDLFLRHYCPKIFKKVDEDSQLMLVDIKDPLVT